MVTDGTLNDGKIYSDVSITQQIRDAKLVSKCCVQYLLKRSAITILITTILIILLTFVQIIAAFR